MRYLAGLMLLALDITDLQITTVSWIEDSHANPLYKLGVAEGRCEYGLLT